MADPDFTLDGTKSAEAETLKPLYARILNHDKTKPTVVITGAANLQAAADWLDLQHAAYIATIGRRSGLLKAMTLSNMVTLTEAT